MTDTLLRASLQSGVALLVIAVLCFLFRRLPASTRCWLWRLGYVKCLVTLAIPTVISLPVFPAKRPSGIAKMPSGIAKSNYFVTKSTPPAAKSEAPAAPLPPPAAKSTPPLALLYLLGAGVALVHLALAGTQTLHLLHKATPNSHPALADLVARFGLRKAPRIARLANFTSPLLAFNTILLPEPALADEHLILAHELAHVKRRDLLWEAIGATVQTLFWFHPLVWWARREEKLAREQAADALVLAVTNAPRAEYARVLLTTTLRHTPALAVGAFASPSRLRRRLEALTQPALPKHKTLGLLTLATVLALPALIPWRTVARQAFASRVAVQGRLAENKRARKRPFRVFGQVTEGGRPLANARVHVTELLPRWKYGYHNTRTDAQGRYSIELPSWPGLTSLLGVDDMPFEKRHSVGGAVGEKKEIDIALPDKANPNKIVNRDYVEGVVLSPEGKPVSGVRVWGEGRNVTTDAQGRFKYGTERLEHPSPFYEMPTWERVIMAFAPGYGLTVTSLSRTGPVSLTVRLAQASTTTIRLVDAQGKPLPGGAALITGLEDAQGKMQHPDMRFTMEMPRADERGTALCTYLPRGRRVAFGETVFRPTANSTLTLQVHSPR